MHLRLVAPPALAERAYRLLRGHPSALNVVRFVGAAERPEGDLLEGDVAREDASVIVAELRELGIERDGSIAIEPVSSLVSDAARRAEEAAVGSPADAVVWETVEFQTSESAALSFNFVAFMVLATMIAALGIIQDSVILIIGAMVVGPEFGPIAGFCVALVQRRGELARRSLGALALGFPAGIGAALGLTLLLQAVDSAPGRLSSVSHPATLFISHPDEYSALVALFAGTAGALSLSTAKSGADRRPYLRHDDSGRRQCRRRVCLRRLGRGGRCDRPAVSQSRVYPRCCSGHLLRTAPTVPASPPAQP